MIEGISEILDAKDVNSQKNSLSGHVFNYLREAILSGKYQENEELKEAAIGKEVGVSRTPVREALRQLELEGLVQIIPNKGAVVTGISLKDVKDIYEMRALLEGLCVRKAIANITDPMISELEEIVELTEFYISKGKLEPILELDNQYHETLYKAAGSKIIRHTLTDFHHYLQRMRKTTLNDIDRAKKSNEEHIAILNAIKEHNADEGEKLANAHIKSSIRNIENHGLW